MDEIFVNLGGVRLVVAGEHAATKSILDRIRSKERLAFSVAFCNAYTISLADENNQYKKLLNQFDLVFVDGKPLAWLMKIKNKDSGQARGPSVFESVLLEGQSLGLRHFLLGSTNENLSLLEKAILAKYPGCKVVGKFSPSFGALDPHELSVQDALILESRPDIVWVGLGTPKQDFESMRIVSNLDVNAIGVGAAFDFLAGTKKEAPRFLQKSGLEWLFRLMTEPRRPWKRYLLGNIRFLIAVFRNL